MASRDSMIPVNIKTLLYRGLLFLKRRGASALRKIPYISSTLGISSHRISSISDWIGSWDGQQRKGFYRVLFPGTTITPVEPKCPTCEVPPGAPQGSPDGRHYNYWDPRSGFDSQRGFYQKPVEVFSEVFLAKIPNGRVLGPGGSVLSENNELFTQSIWTWDDWLTSDRSQTSFWLPSPIRLQGPAYAVTSNQSEGYPHWLMEVLPRLYGLTRLDVGCQPLLIFKGEVKSWQIESLELIGFGDYPRISLKDDFLESSELYFPSYVGVPGTPHPQGCLWVRERILENTEFDTTSRRIYITRRLTEKRRLLNEEEIVPILNKFGFEIVEAERLSFVEQVTLFRTAEAVVAPHGAGLANLMWVPAGCKVFELLDRDYVNDHFYNLSSILALDYHYQLCESENAVNGRPLVTGRDHMMVDVNKFKVTMELMLGQ